MTVNLTPGELDELIRLLIAHVNADNVALRRKLEDARSRDSKV